MTEEKRNSTQNSSELSSNTPASPISKGESGEISSAPQKPGKLCLLDFTQPRLVGFMLKLGEPAYRAQQLWQWLYRRLALDFNEMADLPASLRQRLAGQSYIRAVSPQQELKGKLGTVKALLALADGKTIESTLMSFPAGAERRYTVCVSTQVGCPVGCPFCATGQQGFERNLTAGEIIDQVLHFARRLRDDGKDSHISNIVFMGMGEPLANYDALLQAIEVLNSPQGFGLGARHMTISTAGLIPQIKKLSGSGLQVGLAISLHAGTDDLRNRLVPINKRFRLERLMEACQDYVQTAGRRISFEYILFAGLNDSASDARNLAQLLSGLSCHVNLIPANPTADKRFQPSQAERVLAFQRELTGSHIPCTVRQSRGQDITAGCGQLRSRVLKSGASKTARS